MAGRDSSRCERAPPDWYRARSGCTGPRRRDPWRRPGCRCAPGCRRCLATRNRGCHRRSRGRVEWRGNRRPRRGRRHRRGPPACASPHRCPTIRPRATAAVPPRGFRGCSSCRRPGGSLSGNTRRPIPAPGGLGRRRRSARARRRSCSPRRRRDAHCLVRAIPTGPATRHRTRWVRSRSPIPEFPVPSGPICRCRRCRSPDPARRSP